MVEFKGSDYNEARDKARLERGMGRVLAVIRDGQWWTVEQIQEEILERYGIRDKVTSISSNIRNLRKMPNGDYNIPDAEHIGNGFYKYHLLPGRYSQQGVPMSAPKPEIQNELFGPLEHKPRYGMIDP